MPEYDFGSMGGAVDEPADCCALVALETKKMNMRAETQKQAKPREAFTDTSGIGREAEDGSAGTGRMEAFFVRDSGVSFRYADYLAK